MSGGEAEGTEVEWQLDALDLRPVERWLAALPSRAYGDDLPTLTVLAKPPRRLVDRYVDTEDWRVAQAGFVLRTRQRGRATEATMKDTRAASSSGLRRRLEVTQALVGGDLASLGSEGPVGRRVSAVAGRRPLVQKLEVRTRRLPFSLRAAGEEVAELALDETTIVVGPGQPPARLRRVEVEVAADWVDALTPVIEHLQESCGLRPATLSKFEAGLLAAGVTVPGPPELGATAVAPDATLGELAAAVLRRHLRDMLAHEPGTRLGEDVEELHDMRVATRRLRAALDVFSDALPVRAETLRGELKWFADALGAVRDLDVQLERMDEMTHWSSGWIGAEHGATLGRLRALLEAEREDARRALLAALDSTRWERLVTGLVVLARQGGSRRLPAARTPAAAGIPPLVLERHRGVMQSCRRATRTGLAADYHRLRIRGKRLRYSLEFASGIYGDGTKPYVKKLTAVQDTIGRMQDAEVASARLLALATTDDPRFGSLPATTVFFMGGLAERYRQESEELRRSVAKRLHVLNGKTWKALASLMARAARQFEPAPQPRTRTFSPRAATAPSPASGDAGGDANRDTDTDTDTDETSHAWTAPMAAGSGPFDVGPVDMGPVEVGPIDVGPGDSEDGAGDERVERETARPAGTEVAGAEPATPGAGRFGIDALDGSGERDNDPYANGSSGEERAAAPKSRDLGS